MKKKTDHLGQKIKRLRSFKGMTQEELATAIGKTRSLISFFETTGNINRYTLQEIAVVLGASIDEIEAFDSTLPNTLQDLTHHSISYDSCEKLIEQQRAEIEFLKETINKQWHLLNELTKGKGK